MSDEEDIDENWSLPPRPLRPLPQVAKLTEERDRLRAMLVKACVDIVGDNSFDTKEDAIEYVHKTYGIRIRWNGETFEEDAGK